MTGPSSDPSKSNSWEDAGDIRPFSDEDFDLPASPKAGSSDLHPVAAAAHDYFARAKVEAEEQDQERAAQPPPKYPFLLGIVEYPFYLNTLLCWIPLSGFIVFGALILAFSASIRASSLVFAFTIGYAAAAATRIIETTANGLDEVENWPTLLEWKEVMWSYLRLLNYLTWSLLVAAALTWWSGFLYWIPMMLVIFIVFPYVVLSALEADSWLPVSTVIPRTLKTHPWAWGIFYLEAIVLIVAWSILTFVIALAAGAFALVITGPLLAALMIIYARLLGRLAWVINQPADFLAAWGGRR